MFVQIGTGAALPGKITDTHNDLWEGRRDDAREIGQEKSLNPLQKAPPMLWWTITHRTQNASLSIISPVDFRNRAILVPPQGIYIDRRLKGTGMVKRMQGILEVVAGYNNAYLGALVETYKIETVGPDMIKAGYRVLGEQGCCQVFIHRDSEDKESELIQLFDINS